LACDFKTQFGLKSDEVREHHDLAPSTINQEHATIAKIIAAIMSPGNPFVVENDSTIFNLMTLAVFLSRMHVSHILSIDGTGQKL